MCEKHGDTCRTPSDEESNGLEPDIHVYIENGKTKVEFVNLEDVVDSTRPAANAMRAGAV